MKLKIKPGLARFIDEEITQELEIALDALVQLPLDSQARFQVTKIENLLCERPKNDLQEP